MTTKDNEIVSKDTKQLAKNVLLEYFEADKVVKLLSIFGTDQFFDKLRKYTKDNDDIYNELVDRFIDICSNLVHMLHIIKERDNDESDILKRIYKNRCDIECGNKVDFVNGKYTVESNVKYALNRLSMTQAELCRRTGIPKNTLNNIMRNPSRTGFMNIVKIAYVLNMSIHELFYIKSVNKDK